MDIGLNDRFWKGITQEEAIKYKIELHYSRLTDDGEHEQRVIETKDGTTMKWLCHNEGKDHEED